MSCTAQAALGARGALGAAGAGCRELGRSDAWRVAGNADLPGPRVRPLPLLDGVTGHAANVSKRLRWQRAFSTEPLLHALGTGVVGGGREPEIAELGAQLAQKLGRFRQRLGRIERIEQETLGGRRRHELRDALRTLAAAGDGSHRIGSQAAFLPNQTSEELDRQLVLRRY